MGVLKRILGGVVGLLFGVIASFALVPAAAAFVDKSNPSIVSLLPLVAALAGLILGILAPTIRRAFGRGFLLLGASVFLLPLSMMLLSGRVTNDMVQTAESGTETSTAVGAGIAGVLMTGVAGIIGFFVGAILLIIGLVLVLGGRREVVVRA